MAPILTPEDVDRRIAAECTFVDERGAVGIREGTGRCHRTAVRGAIPSTAASAAAFPSMALQNRSPRLTDRFGILEAMY